MVPGNGKNWSIVVTVGIVELIEVTNFLTEVIDDVSEVKQEGGAALAIVLPREIGGHGVGDGELMRWLFDSARVADRMKDNTA